MRFYTNQHRYYCGIDLHARSMYVCILDPRGQILLHKNNAVCPGIVPQSDCSLPRRHRRRRRVHVRLVLARRPLQQTEIPFVLGHALYMKAIHGGKAKNDKIDARRSPSCSAAACSPWPTSTPDARPATCSAAAPTSSATPTCHPPAEHQQPVQPARVRQEARLRRQPRWSCRALQRPQRAKKRRGRSKLISLRPTLSDVELYIVRTAKEDDAAFDRLRSVPGIGKVWPWSCSTRSTTSTASPQSEIPLLLTPGQCAHESAGKKQGTSGNKIGNAHLKWAFSEASVLFLRANPKGQRFVEKLSSKHGKAKALSILAHKLGRAVYYMLSRKQAFDMNKFFSS